MIKIFETGSGRTDSSIDSSGVAGFYKDRSVDSTGSRVAACFEVKSSFASFGLRTGSWSFKADFDFAGRPLLAFNSYNLPFTWHSNDFL